MIIWFPSFSFFAFFRHLWKIDIFSYIFFFLLVFLSICKRGMFCLFIRWLKIDSDFFPLSTGKFSKNSIEERTKNLCKEKLSRSIDESHVVCALIRLVKSNQSEIVFCPMQIESDPKLDRLKSKSLVFALLFQIEWDEPSVASESFESRTTKNFQGTIGRCFKYLQAIDFFS